MVSCGAKLEIIINIGNKMWLEKDFVALESILSCFPRDASREPSDLNRGPTRKFSYIP
jgi:hypothetical protein